MPENADEESYQCLWHMFFGLRYCLKHEDNVLLHMHLVTINLLLLLLTLDEGMVTPVNLIVYTFNT